MTAGSASKEILLLPGGLWFGEGDVQLSTLLGSCVAITLWHPRHRAGGMCHFMLPGQSAAGRHAPDGRYASDAMIYLMQRAATAGLRLTEFEAKLFGGGRMHPDGGAAPLPGSPYAVHERNVEAARALLARHQLPITAEHLGGQGHRHLRFHLSTGEAWLRHTPLGAATGMTTKACA